MLFFFSVCQAVIKSSVITFLLAFMGVLFSGCESHPTEQTATTSVQDTLVYLNHADSAKYAGIQTCKLCHQQIYNTFVKTGMGKSFDLATKHKSSADFSHPLVTDPYTGFKYTAFWNHDSLYMREFRMQQRDTEYVRTERVNFIVGSGQHTNSHLQVVNGYLQQMPMTFYTQKKRWDLPPGFENNMNTRFTRKIGLECMSCHNAYPKFVAGSENKYTSIPSGIDCERCHGPGSIHVAQRQTGSKVDTAKAIDYSIVNPAKLSIDLQFDLCQRCHLQGNAILKEGKSFLDYKPGKKLSDVLTVFLPKYQNADDEFIMASHADRLKQSPCFIQSYERVKNKNALKPYREALTCVTCHNPHVSVKETAHTGFISACLNCHYSGKVSELSCSETNVQQRMLKQNKQVQSGDFTAIPNCITCHMPVSGSTDIPHVSVHDHYIRKPITRKEKEKIKTFLGVYAINEKNPDAITRAKAYLNQFEKFEQLPLYLDSANVWLRKANGQPGYEPTLVQLFFMQQNYLAILKQVQLWGEEKCFTNLFSKPSLDNRDAWTSYRIAEAYVQTGNATSAIKWFGQAIKLAPYQLDFRNKYATALASAGNYAAAREQYEFVLNQHPKLVSVYTNLGYLYMLDDNLDKALQLYQIGLNIDPDNEALLLNLSAYYLATHNSSMTNKTLQHLLSKHPGNKKAREVLKQLTSAHGR